MHQNLNVSSPDPPVLDSALPSEPVSLVYGQALSLSCASSSATYWEWFQNATKYVVIYYTIAIAIICSLHAIHDLAPLCSAVLRSED